MSNNDNIVLVVDTEATCWDDKPREYQVANREIIEIGIVKLDLNSGKILDKESYLIRNITSDVSAFCTKLTGITQEMIDNEGVTLHKAGSQIRKRFGKFTWVSWGDFDRKFIEDQCRKVNAPYFLSPNHINLSQLFRFKMKSNKRLGLGKALGHYKIKFEGDRHRALPDAIATAKVMVEMFK